MAQWQLATSQRNHRYAAVGQLRAQRKTWMDSKISENRCTAWCTTVCTFTLNCFIGLALVWLLAVLIYFLTETHTYTPFFFFFFSKVSKISFVLSHYSHLTLTTQVLENTYLIHVHTDIILLSCTLCIGYVDISTFMLYRFVAALAL